MTLPPRSVWIDAQGAQNTQHFERGIARHVGEVTRALLETAPEVVHTIGLNPSLPVSGALNQLLGAGHLGWQTGKGTAPSTPPPIYHALSPFEGVTMDAIWPAWARRDGVRTVVTLHDLIPLLYPDRYPDYYRLFFTGRLGLVRGAHRVLAISQSTAADAVEHLGIEESRISVIDSGVSGRMASLVGSREEAKRLLASSVEGLREPFLLYVGGDDWRKNMEGMVSAYGLLPKRLQRAYQLVIVCKLSDERRAELMAHARRVGIGGSDLLLTGFVPDRPLAALYRACELFVFPSLYEGGGLPVLEAMSCGAPVAAARTSSVPEILGDEEATFDPSDPSDIAACLERTLEDDQQLEALRRRSRERAGRFTWGRVAENILAAYERALAGPGRQVSRSRARLAVFTPWPPDETPVAAHSRRLVERLADHAEVDVIVEGTPEGAKREDGSSYDDSLAPRVRLWSAGEFERIHGIRDYDQILYVLGNSDRHVYALQALLRRPGSVLAHDVRLTRVYHGLHHEVEIYEDPDWLSEKLAGMYGGRVPDDQLGRIPDDEVEARYGVLMSQEVQTHAERILVHSGAAVEALELDRLPGESTAATEVMAYGIPAARRDESPAGDEGGRLVVSQAVDSDIEATELLLHGFSELVSRLPGARLAVLGSLGEEARDSLSKTASQLGIDGSMRITESLDGEEYWRTLANADLAVQLRTNSEGEASAAVCDCLAARLPTIVSDVGWFRQIPAPAVLAVPPDCPPAVLAERMAAAIEDDGLRGRIKAAQDEHAAANSFSRVAERFAEALAL